MGAARVVFVVCHVNDDADVRARLLHRQQLDERVGVGERCRFVADKHNRDAAIGAKRHDGLVEAGREVRHDMIVGIAQGNEACREAGNFWPGQRAQDAGARFSRQNVETAACFRTAHRFGAVGHNRFRERHAARNHIAKVVTGRKTKLYVDVGKAQIAVNRSTRRRAAASACAMETANQVFPMPPFPDATWIMRMAFMVFVPRGASPVPALRRWSCRSVSSGRRHMHSSVPDPGRGKASR